MFKDFCFLGGLFFSHFAVIGQDLLFPCSVLRGDFLHAFQKSVLLKKAQVREMKRNSHRTVLQS